MIDLKGITFGYKKDNFIYKNLNLSIKKGAIVGILGHNGAGKTTLFRLLSGLVSPFQGTILINNENPNINKKQRGFLSYMPENGGIYNHLTVMQNIRFRAELFGVKKEILDLTCKNHLKKIGLKSRSNDKTSELSNGMKKRLMFSCACVNSPQLLLLDEPTNGVDQESLNEIYLLLKDLKEQNTTILINTHDFNTVNEICDHVIIINNGVLVYDGEVLPPQDLRELYLSFTTEEDENDDA